MYKCQHLHDADSGEHLPHLLPHTLKEYSKDRSGRGVRRLVSRLRLGPGALARRHLGLRPAPHHWQGTHTFSLHLNNPNFNIISM